MFDFVADLLDSIESATDGVPDPTHAASGGEVHFGHHGEIQNGSFVSVPDPGEVTTSADNTDYLSPSEKNAGINPQPKPNPT